MTRGAEVVPIERMDVAVYTVPTQEPESDGTLAWTATTVVTVSLEAAGVRGLGFTYGSAACATLIHGELREVVVGADALDVPTSWLWMARAIRNNGRPGISSMAIAAVDIALWDLKARVLDLSLAALLGQAHEVVPIYGSGGFTSLTEAELRSQLGGWAHDQKIPRVKMKTGTNFGECTDRDLARLHIARDAIGPEVELFVDANGAYSRKQAIRIGRQFAEAGVRWFEEPVSSDDLEGLAEVRAQCDLDVAAGEYGYDVAYFERMAPVVDCLQADVSRCGGISEWLRAAAVAASHNLELSGHCAPQLHAHVACAIPNLRHVEWFADHVRVDHLLFDGVLEPRGGTLRPDRSRAGMGLTLKSDAERFRVS